MKNTTTTTTTRFDHFLDGLSDEEIKRELTNRILIYQNKGKSSVKVDGERQVKFAIVEKVGYNKISGSRFMQGYIDDIDDKGKRKTRTLTISRIKEVRGRIATAYQLVKSVF